MKKIIIMLSVFLLSAPVLRAQSDGGFLSESESSGESAEVTIYKEAPAKYESVIEKAILRACSDMGCEAEKIKSANRISVLYNADGANTLQDRVTISYSQKGFEVSYYYDEQRAAEIAGEDAKNKKKGQGKKKAAGSGQKTVLSRQEMSALYNEWVARLYYRVKENIVKFGPEAERSANMQEITFKSHVKNKNTIKLAIFEALKDAKWQYKILRDGSFDIWFDTGEYIYFAQIYVNDDGYSIKADMSEGFSKGDSDYMLNFMRQKIKHLSMYINKGIVVESNSPEVFTGEGGPQTNEGMLEIIKAACRRSGWKIGSAKNNNVVASFWQKKESKGATVDIYYKASESGSEYKITYKDSNDMGYNKRKNEIDPLYNKQVFYLNLAINTELNR